MRYKGQANPVLQKALELLLDPDFGKAKKMQKFSIARVAPNGTIEVYLRIEANGNRFWTSEKELAQSWEHWEAELKLKQIPVHSVDGYMYLVEAVLHRN